MRDFIRVLHLTDTHLFADDTECLLGINTQDSFNSTLQAINSHPQQHDLVLLTGDLVHDEAVITYERLAFQVSNLHAPVYWLAGNHDDPEAILTGMHGSTIHANKIILKDNWQIILLNSQLVGASAGFLAAAELKFLNDCLELHPNLHALICLHHHVVPTGSAWLDTIGLKNPDDLFKVIDRYPQVRAILHGHIHQAFEEHYKNIPIFSTPATSIQFKPKTEDFMLDPLPPGYRYLDLHKDGKITTEVHRVEKFLNFVNIDEKATGY